MANLFKFVPRVPGAIGAYSALWRASRLASVPGLGANPWLAPQSGPPRVAPCASCGTDILTDRAIGAWKWRPRRQGAE